MTQTGNFPTPPGGDRGTNIYAAGTAQDQVILPTSVAFRICVGGIRTRLGRSVVTVLGVALGVAFLTSVVTGVLVQRGVASEAELRRDVERRVSLLRAEVGRFRGKQLLIFAPPSQTESQQRFIEELRATPETDVIVQTAAAGDAASPDAADAADAMVMLEGGGEGLASRFAAADDALGGEFYSYESIEEGLAAGLSEAGVSAHELVLAQRAEEVQREAERQREELLRILWIIVVSLLITTIGISNAMLMSVTERVREIGTMKCLGALSSFVVKLFVIESGLVGLFGAAAGVLIGVVFSIIAYGVSFGFGTVLLSISYPMLLLAAVGCTLVGLTLSVVAGIYPARVAAKMIPAAALASHV